MKRILLILLLLPSLAFAQPVKPPINGVAGPTTSTQLQSILTDGANNVQVQATGTTTPRTLAARFSDLLNPRDFGARCDGSTNDKAALDLWLAALPNSKGGFIPSVCAFTTALATVAGNNITIYGAGWGSSGLRYTGAGTTPGNLVTFSGGTNLSLYDFTIDSSTTLASGWALKVSSASNVNLNIVFGQQTTYKLYNGFWFDSSIVGNLNSTQTYVQNEGVSANDCIELHFNHAFLRGQILVGAGTGYGAHIGGGCGGVYLENTTQLQNRIGFLADTAVSASGNSQFFFGDSTWDTNKDAAVFFNDSVTNAIGKSINAGNAWFASSTAGDGFSINAFASGTFNAGAAVFKNNFGNGFKIADSTVRVEIGTGSDISYNGGYGVSSASPITILTTANPHDNTSGAYDSNVTPSGPSVAGVTLLPQTAPSSPAAGWTLYTDSGDANKIKAKASNGTVVTLGTP